MTNTEKLVRGITLGAQDEGEAEAAFLQRFEELVELPVEVSVAGAGQMLTRLELTPILLSRRRKLACPGGHSALDFGCISHSGWCV